MIGLVRWTAFILEIGGLYQTMRLYHDGRLGAALLFLFFDTVVVIVFVSSHCLVEWVLMKQRNKRAGIWWL